MAMNVVIDMLDNRNGANRANNIERKKRRIAGFTMAELLIVVAIIGVLAAVSFIAVQAHQRSMTQLQYDAIAKEIFVAAQNHLTLAKSENYLGSTNMGTLGTAKADKTGGDKEKPGTNKDVYYFTSSDFTADGSSILDQMLPFGSVELVTGGSFIIRYQPKAARVLDVFYWTDDARYGIDGVEYKTAVDEYRDTEDSSKKGDRAKYKSSGILGWCGGEGIVDSGEYLEAPEIEVINAEMLLVTVTDPNMGKTALAPKLKLLVTGNLSGAKVAIPLTLEGAAGRIVPIDNGKQYTVVLDDITTAGRHFADLQNETTYTFKKEGELSIPFKPGENLTIQAVAYSNDVLTSVAYSGEWTSNSLFGEITEDLTGSTPVADKVLIANIRHLENLNDGLSSVAYSNAYFNNAISAVQTADLDWSAFKTALNTLKKEKLNSSSVETSPINIYDKNNATTKDDCFLPVTVAADYTLNYDGQNEVELTEGETTTTIRENHSIKGIVVDNTGDAPGTAAIASGGVFGALKGATIKNLALIDTTVTLASGDAGALVGMLTQDAALASDAFNISNVVAYHTDGKADSAKITSASGNAGGLIGQTVGGNCKVEKSAAALIVKSDVGSAGGLIGKAEAGSVSGCYSGGHTIVDSKGSGAVVYDSKNYNVTASTYAGGLIGDAGACAISDSYSTCSAIGKNAGGFVGNATGTISNSYCTGLVGVTVGNDGKPVAGTTSGAFAAACTGATIDCQYYEIINAFADDALGYDYLTPLPKAGLGDGSKDGVTALDKDADSYNAFTSVWSPAEPYLKTTLMQYYGEGSGTDRVAKYNLKTIDVLKASEDAGAGDSEEEEDDSTPSEGDGTPGEDDSKPGEGEDAPATAEVPADFVATHYGDWPVPEIFVVNTKDTSTTPAVPTP